MRSSASTAHPVLAPSLLIACGTALGILCSVAAQPSGRVDEELVTEVHGLSPSSAAASSCDSTARGLEAAWIPARRADAITGSDFARKTRGWAGVDRQRAALEELRQGNMPDFLRRLKPVHLEYTRADGRVLQAVVWVSPDYLSIGSDEDYLRIPLTRPRAVTLAAELGFVLPTPKIVDAIHEQADYRFMPRPIPPGPMMRSSEYYQRHHEMIEKERAGRPLGELLSGHKKDVVLTNRLRGNGRIAIYGWHRRNGEPIQGLSTVHDARYADYSHGIRLVYATVCIDGEPRSIYDILASEELGPVLTYEGTITRYRDLMHW